MHWLNHMWSHSHTEGVCVLSLWKNVSLSQGLFQRDNLLRISQDSGPKSLSLIRSNQHAVIHKYSRICLTETLKKIPSAHSGGQWIIKRPYLQATLSNNYSFLSMFKRQKLKLLIRCSLYRKIRVSHAFLISLTKWQSRQWSGKHAFHELRQE